MAGFTIIHSEMRDGIWNGVVSGPKDGNQPDIEISCLDRVLDGVSLEDQGLGVWKLSFPVPADLLSDGVQILVVTEKSSGTRIGNYPIISGQSLEDDFRVEVELLRAEVELLKKTLRKHCSET